ncbi:hypothetical protein KCA24_05250 [Escherichia coli]|nr:hypothetical protein [Escherichia coli]
MSVLYSVIQGLVVFAVRRLPSGIIRGGSAPWQPRGGGGGGGGVRVF